MLPGLPYGKYRSKQLLSNMQSSSATASQRPAQQNPKDNVTPVRSALRGQRPAQQSPARLCYHCPTGQAVRSTQIMHDRFCNIRPTPPSSYQIARLN